MSTCVPAPPVIVRFTHYRLVEFSLSTRTFLEMIGICLAELKYERMSNAEITDITEVIMGFSIDFLL